MKKRKLMNKALIITALLLWSELCYANISAPLLSQPIATSTQVLTLVYDPNEIFRLRLCTRYQTIIQLSTKEQIKYISFGDPSPWNMKVIGNTIYITPRNPTQPTNMTVVTDQRTYLYEISAVVTDDLINQSCIYMVRFFYPEINPDAPTITTKRAPLDQKLNTPEKSEIKREVRDAEGRLMNFNYSLSGRSELIAPLEVFDDGSKTYMRFIRDNDFVPSLYVVNEIGLEAPVRFTRENRHIVIDTVGKQFALRSNGELICVFNDFLIDKEIKAKNGKK
jgi:type IV secretion system protein VirB9